MKLFIASDLHGSAYYTAMMLEQFKKSGAEQLVLLGDILYHGPRNDLPLDYNPKKVAEMLNLISDKILAVRGNCDSEVDQMLLNFPIMSDYCLLFDGENEIFATHGHVYGPDNPPKHSGKLTLLGGHTHVTADENMGDIRYLNPGSVSIPKNNTKNGYMILENGEFKHRSLD